MHPSDLPATDMDLPPPLLETLVHEQRAARLDTVPEEVPVALSYNGISHAVMLASPTDLEDFALGFSLSEGILEQPSQLYDLEVETGDLGVEARMRIAEECFFALKGRRRTLAGRTGCGLCGRESLEQVARALAPLPARPPLPVTTLQTALGQLQASQPLHARTGGVHAAAWADQEGRLHTIREDVGRHNALDKLIGALARQGQSPESGFALITSRASFEMVQKAASAGISVLAAVSAPTGYAIRTAESLGLCLVGFLRPGRHTCYAHPERLQD